MSENKLLSFLLTEGIFLIILGIILLILPKLSTLTFGTLICVSFILYGGYKIIKSIMLRNTLNYFILKLFTGILLFIIGLVMLFVPMFNYGILLAFIGLYFLLESFSSTIFLIQTRKGHYFWWSLAIVFILQLLFALIIFLTLPSLSIWLLGVLTGLYYFITGIVMVNLYLSSKFI